MAVSSNTDCGLANQAERVRRSMIEVNKLFYSGKIKFPMHLAFGHEAIAVALASAKKPLDFVLLPHRNLHYQFACVSSDQQIIDECQGLSTGINGGTTGIMNMVNTSEGIIYTSSVLGNNLPVAVGCAYGASKLRGCRSVTWVVTGDGAIEEGAWYESLLFSSFLRLPVVFIVENNRWSLATEVTERRKDIELNEFAKIFGMDYQKLSNSNTHEYTDKLISVRKKAIKSMHPQIVEVEVKTLGSYSLKEKNRAPRLINYHAGGVKQELLSNLRFLDENLEDFQATFSKVNCSCRVMGVVDVY